MLNLETLMEYGPLGLFLLAFCESIFFPVPPDFVLLPMALGRPNHAFWYASVATVASLAGALTGYMIGKKAGRPIVERYFSEDRFNRIEKLFAKHGAWAVGIAAFTPLPFKLFTLAGGIFHVKLWTFLIASTIGRGVRFFLESSLVFFLGRKAVSLLGKNFELITVGITAVVLVCVWLAGKLRLWEKLSTWLFGAKKRISTTGK